MNGCIIAVHSNLMNCESMNFDYESIIEHFLIGSEPVA